MTFKDLQQQGIDVYFTEDVALDQSQYLFRKKSAQATITIPKYESPNELDSSFEHEICQNALKLLEVEENHGGTEG